MVEIEWLTWKSASDHFDCDSFASLCHGSEVCPSHLDSDRLTMQKNEAAPVKLPFVQPSWRYCAPEIPLKRSLDQQSPFPLDQEGPLLAQTAQPDVAFGLGLPV
jgi:hypothetical protein